MMERLRIRGAGGAVECEWAAAALLRDNVMHYLEGSAPTGRFPAIHALADAPASPGRPLPGAGDVADELAIVLPLLSHLRGADLAVGIWTRARMSGQRTPPAMRGTMLARVVGWPLPMPVADEVAITDLYRPFLAALRRAASGRSTAAA